MKNHIRTCCLMLAFFVTLQPAIAAQHGAAQGTGITDEAAELFQKMVTAHGGPTINEVLSYTDEGVLLTYGPAGEVVQESPFRTLVDYRDGRVRTELIQGDELVMLQQAGPDGGYAWSNVAGELPVPPESTAELLIPLSTGLHGIIQGFDGVESATILGDLTFADVSGVGLEIVRNGQAVVILVSDDGLILGDSYESAQLGTMHTIYTDYETVDGILVPTAYESFAFGMKILGGRLDTVEFGAELDKAAFAAVSADESPEVSEDALAWLADIVVPFDSVQAGAGFEDLREFGDMVGDARVVALGEQTHGTSEFFTMKHRLLEYLVTEKGFTIFAIEANLPEAFRIDDYIKSGEGNSQALLQGLYFWTWYTQEVLDLIEWMHDYNLTATEPVHFVGFDMQYPNVAIAQLRSFLTKADPEYLAEIDSILEAADQPISLTSTPGPVDWEMLERIAAVVGDLEEKRAFFVQSLNEQAVDRALQNARIVAQAVGLLEDNAGVAHRDAAMASNVEWLLAHYPNEKMVIWAHNGHVAETDNWMGGHLDAALGDDYFSVAFSFHDGDYRAMAAGGSGGGSVGIHTAGPALDGSIDAVLNQVGPERFYLDLRNAESTPAASWLAEERLFRSIGAIATPTSSSFSLTTLAEDFDAVIFIRESSASEALEPITQ